VLICSILPYSHCICTAEFCTRCPSCLEVTPSYNYRWSDLICTSFQIQTSNIPLQKVLNCACDSPNRSTYGLFLNLFTYLLIISNSHVDSGINDNALHVLRSCLLCLRLLSFLLYSYSTVHIKLPPTALEDMHVICLFVIDVFRLLFQLLYLTAIRPQGC